MLKPDDTHRGKVAAILVFVVPALLIVALDLWTKEAVFALLKVEQEGSPPRVVAQERYVVVEDFFWFEANYNYGAFSGWFSDYTPGLAVLSVVAGCAIVGVFLYHLLRAPRVELLFVLSLGLLLGGDLGNLYDRAVLQAVRDWIRWFVVIHGRQHVWPNFNIADSAICVGVSLLFLREFFTWRADRRKQATQADVEATTSSEL